MGKTTKKKKRSNTMKMLEKFESNIKKARLETECCICFDLMVAPVILTCGHNVCEQCLAKWLEQQETCPICRTKFEQHTSNIALRNLICDTIVPMGSNENAIEYAKRVKEFDVWKQSQ